jgi:NADPH:quinone reductase-like Zn-dependent oxidoreductase
VHGGSWTELVSVPAEQAARKPDGVDFAAAGAAPVAGLTAMAAITALDPQEGETVLIIGAAGGVGAFAVQLARRAGAHIIAPGLPEDEGFLVDLGVDHVISRDGDVVAQTRELEDGGAAALLDTVSRSPEEFEVHAAALADGGRAASPVRAAGEGPGRHNVGGSTEGGALEELAQLLEEGALKVPIQRTYPLDEAGAALADLPGKHTQGKLAIAVAP